MPDFARPEYASYRSLTARYEQVGNPCWYNVHGHIVEGLPSLADLLEMLEEAGHDVVVISGTSRNGYGASCCMDADGNCAHHGGTAPTREEACARLWMAVTRRDA